MSSDHEQHSYLLLSLSTDPDTTRSPVSLHANPTCPGRSDPPDAGPGSIDLSLDTDVTDTIHDTTTAHAWTFSGRAGQVVTITARIPDDSAPPYSADPRLRLLGPDGAELARADCA